MPLKYTDHSQKPQLEEELRNLYRQVDKLTAGAGTAIILPGGGGHTHEGDDHTHEEGGEGGWWNIATWNLLVELNEDMPPMDTVYPFDIPVPAIEIPYTHLELHMAILGLGGTGINLEWTVQGLGRYWFWNSPGTSPPFGGPYGEWKQTQNPKHYVFTAPWAAGRYEIEPQYAVPITQGDLAFMLIYPARVVDGPQWPAQSLQLSAKVTRASGDLSGGFCYKVKFVGRYVMYPTDIPLALPCAYDI